MSIEKLSRFRIVVSFVIVGVTLFMLSFAALLFLTKSQKEKSAALFAAASHDLLTTGDFRTPMTHLNVDIKDQFLLIEYRPKLNGQPVFQLGEKGLKGEFIGQVEIPAAATGALRFYFDYSDSFPAFFLLWGLIFLINIPIYFCLNRKLKAYYINKLNQQKLIEAGKISRRVAHDLKSPLTVLNVLAAKKNCISEKDYALFVAMANRINAIADDLLSVGDNSLFKKSKPNLIEVNSTVETFCQMKAMELKDKDIEFKFSSRLERQSVYIPGQEDVFFRMLSNLVNNSVEALNENRRITIELWENRDSVFIEVADTGCGIRRASLPFIFNEGFSDKKCGGHGIGLSYVKEKVTDWGGNIKISSRVGVGTSVILSFKMATIDQNSNLECHNSIAAIKEA